MAECLFYFQDWQAVEKQDRPDKTAKVPYAYKPSTPPASASNICRSRFRTIDPQFRYASEQQQTQARSWMGSQDLPLYGTTDTIP